MSLADAGMSAADLAAIVGNNNDGSFGNNRGGYSGAKEHLIQEAQRMMDAAVNDEERMAIMGYINRLNS